MTSITVEKVYWFLLFNAKTLSLSMSTLGKGLPFVVASLLVLSLSEQSYHLPFKRKQNKICMYKIVNTTYVGMYKCTP
jgi:branched-subunit amino acid transport protein AzlD